MGGERGCTRRRKEKRRFREGRGGDGAAHGIGFGANMAQIVALRGGERGVVIRSTYITHIIAAGYDEGRIPGAQPKRGGHAGESVATVVSMGKIPHEVLHVRCALINVCGDGSPSKPFTQLTRAQALRKRDRGGRRGIGLIIISGYVENAGTPTMRVRERVTTCSVGNPRRCAVRRERVSSAAIADTAVDTAIVVTAD